MKENENGWTYGFVFRVQLPSAKEAQDKVNEALSFFGVSDKIIIASEVELFSLTTKVTLDSQAEDKFLETAIKIALENYASHGLTDVVKFVRVDKREKD